MSRLFYWKFSVDNCPLTDNFIFHRLIIVMHTALAKNTILLFTLFFVLLFVAASFSLSRVFYKIIN